MNSESIDRTCLHFGLCLPDGELPELLRRVAIEVESIDHFSLLNMVVEECDGDLSATVYYWVTD